MGAALAVAVVALIVTVAAVVPLSIYTARALEDDTTNTPTPTPEVDTVVGLEPVANNTGTVGTATRAFKEGFFVDMDVQGALNLSGGEDGQLLAVNSTGDVGFVDPPLAGPEWARFVLDSQFGPLVTLTYQVRTNQWFDSLDFFVADTGNTLAGASMSNAGVVTLPPGTYRFVATFQVVVTQPSNSQQKLVTAFEPFPIVDPAVDPTTNFVQMFNIVGSLSPVSASPEGFFTATEADSQWALTMMNTSNFTGGGGETDPASIGARQYSLLIFKVA